MIFSPREMIVKNNRGFINIHNRLILQLKKVII